MWSAKKADKDDISGSFLRWRNGKVTAVKARFLRWIHRIRPVLVVPACRHPQSLLSLTFVEDFSSRKTIEGT
jgi:hypothetical protein